MVAYFFLRWMHCTALRVQCFHWHRCMNSAGPFIYVPFHIMLFMEQYGLIPRFIACLSFFSQPTNHLFHEILLQMAPAYSVWCPAKCCSILEVSILYSSTRAWINFVHTTSTCCHFLSLLYSGCLLTFLQCCWSLAMHIPVCCPHSSTFK